MNTELNEAAEKYADKYAVYEKDRPDMIRLFIDFVESSFAKEYWYAQWQLEQKQVLTDEAIEKLAEKEFQYFKGYSSNEIDIARYAFIKGYKAALQYTKPVWVEDILEQVQRKINAISEIHGKPEKASVIGNSIVLFFKDKSVYKQSFISKETTKAVLDESALQYSAGDGWISVSKPPKKNGFYIIHRKDPDKTFQVLMAAWETDHFEVWVDTPAKNVTHWQPLPSPPINK